MNEELPNGTRNITKSSLSVVVNPKAKIKKIVNKDEIYKCTCCGKEYKTQKGNFATSNSILYTENNGYITVCRTCMEKIFYQLIGYFNGNEEHAIERMCQMFDWYYNPRISAMIRNNGGNSVITQYSSKMNLVHIKQKGITYLDTVKEKGVVLAEEPEDDKREVKICDEDEHIKNTQGYIVGSTVSPELVKFFGSGFTNSEYEYLEEQYNDWSTRYECKTKIQEELYKNISIAQLAIQKAQLNQGTKGYSDAVKTFQDLCKAANINPSQSNESLTEQNTFGTLIKRWEDEQPISEPAPEWEDVDNIKKYIDTFFLGHLCNLVHVKNDNQEEYLKEMKKYTVTPPIYDEDEIGNETSLLDKYCDKDKSPEQDDVENIIKETGL